MEATFLKQAVESVIDLIYPRSCGLCRRELEVIPESHPALCRDCVRDLDLREERGCPSCGAKLGPFAPENLRCTHCQNDRFAFEEVFSLGNYTGALKGVCRCCKSESSHSLTLQMGNLLSQFGSEAFSSWEVDLVACVPHHWRKRLTRSYNSSAELAERLANQLNKPFARHLIAKTNHTSDQASLAPSLRRQNVKNSFAVNSHRLVRGRRILLVDDVLTTGSTSDACARILKKAGAETIFVAVLARGLG